MKEVEAIYRAGTSCGRRSCSGRNRRNGNNIPGWHFVRPVLALWEKWFGMVRNWNVFKRVEEMAVCVCMRFQVVIC